MNSTAPTVTPMSATLKIGHHCRSMKSMTAPFKQPVAAERAVDAGCRARRRSAARPRTDRAAVSTRADDTTRPITTTKREHADERSEAAAPRERHAAVEREVPLQRPDHVPRPRVLQVLDRPVLGDLVERRGRPRRSATLARRDGDPPTARPLLARRPAVHDRVRSRRRWRRLGRSQAQPATPRVIGGRSRRPSPRRARSPTGSPRAARGEIGRPDTSE